MKAVTAAEMRDLEERYMRASGVTPLELMERAAEGLARELAAWRGESLARDCFLVVCGRGNNGGDGLALARLLNGKAAQVRAVLLAPRAGKPYGLEVQTNLERARAAGVELAVVDNAAAVPDSWWLDASLIVDALLGTGSVGVTAEPLSGLIAAIGACGRRVVSVDLPSGLSADTGLPADPCITAVLTLTLGLPKVGLLSEHAEAHVGELRVVDIGLPKSI